MPATPRRTRFAALPKSDRGCLALLLAVFFGNHWQLLVGTVSEHWDGKQQFAPYYSLMSRLVRSGHFLFWNPFCSGGSPDFVEPQYGAFSPVLLLFGLVLGPGETSFHLYWLSIWLLGGVGMYVLARALSAPSWGALLTALSFVFSGYYLGHAEHISLVYTYSFVPWILWRVRAALTTGRFWPACEAGALWGLSALAGNPAVVIPAALFVGLVALAWLPARPGAPWWARWRTYAVTMLGLAAIGTVVLAPAYFGFRYEVAGFSERSEPLARALALPSQSLGLGWLSALVSPMLALATFRSPDGPPVDVSYVPIYFGAVLPVLALFALWQRRSRWRAWVVAGTGLFFLGCALGSTLPLRGWLYDLVSLTRFIRHPPMFRGFFVLAVAMLAAPATRVLDHLARRVDARPGGPAGQRLRSLAACAGTGAILGVAVFAWIFCTMPTVLGDKLVPAGCLHFALGWIGLAAVCFAAARRSDFRRRLPGALVLLAIVDLSGAFLLSEEVVYAPAVPRDEAVPDRSLEDLGAPGFARVARTHDNANLYAPTPVFISYTAMTNAYYAAWGKDPLLLRGVTGPQRVWFSPEAPMVPASPATFAAFRRRVHELNGLILLRQERADLISPGASPSASSEVLQAIAAAPPAQPAACRVLRYHANDLALSVTCPRAGWLLLTDRWTRSWQGTVNGKTVPLDGGDFLFRLVPVVAGENRVEMKFQVAWIYPLVLLSWGALATVGIGACWRAFPAPLGVDRVGYNSPRAARIASSSSPSG